MEDCEALKRQVLQLQKELAEARQKVTDLERAKSGGSSGEVGELPVAISEFEETLRRLVQRTAMIVQAEKCVIMVRDRETNDLFARSPAFGMTENEVKSFRTHANCGVSGEVFRTGHPTVFHNTDQDPRAIEEHLSLLRIRNGVTVPLLIEKRDDENHIIDRVMIGVLHCLNKRYGGEFIDEDVRLLERLSRNAAAVIANAQMFQEVVEEKQKLVHTLESLTAGLVLINQHARISQMNAQARAMFGIKPTEEPIGKLFKEVIKHAECIAILERKLAEAENPVVAADGEEEAKKPDEISILDEDEQEYIYQVHAANVHDDDNHSIGNVVIFNDITDLRNVERMKTEFVSIVSHELRTPLTPMKGFVRMLIDDPEEEMSTREDRQEFYGIIDSNVDRLSRLINDLLNVSRIEKLGAAGIEMNWEIVDLRKATEEVLSVQKGRTDRHSFVIDFDPEHIQVETDPDMIQNILNNLVSNAIKYSPDGGEVRVSARIEETDQSVLVGVMDQGMGIPEAYLKKLGQKFVRVDHKGGRNVSGTGIGLFFVKNVVERHGGQMWPESEGLGKGSIFWFRLPLRQPHDEDEAGVQETGA